LDLTPDHEESVEQSNFVTLVSHATASEEILTRMRPDLAASTESNERDPSYNHAPVRSDSKGGISTKKR
jgi:hypothetical protein